MKIFVLYDKSGIHSGRILGTHLIRKLMGKGHQIHKGRPARLDLMRSRGNRYDYIINVGWFKDFEAGNAVVLNTPKSIRLSSNKRGARRLFAEKKVSAPKLWLSAGSLGKRDFPVIARTTHHSKGKGLWLCRNSMEAQRAARLGATHFLKYIPNTREFRVHVMAPKPKLDGMKVEDQLVIKLSEKIPQPGRRVKPNEVVKNHDNGWFFGYPSNRKDPVLKQLRAVARQALIEFGLHWGAVDIMVSKDTGQTFVLEINSTPCLTDDSANTLQKYGDAICEMVGIREREPKKEVKPAPIHRPVAVKRPPRRTPSRIISKPRRKPNAKMTKVLRKLKL